MTLKRTVLTALLATGFTFQNCDLCDCPPIEGDFFDIKGIGLTNYKKKGTCCTEKILANETVNFSDYYEMSLDYTVDYFGSTDRPESTGFSLLNTALACSCDENGTLGSKDERLNTLTILTLNDFDPDHHANDTINDLFDVALYGKIQDLNEYLRQDTALIMSEHLALYLKKAPILNDTFKVKVVLALSTKETYETESVPIRVKN